MRVPFGERGLKIRVLSAGLAALLLGFALGGGDLLDLALPGAKWMGWLFIVLAVAVMFFRVYRSDDEGEVDIMFIHALVPLYLLLPGFIWLLLSDDGDGPSFGHYHVLGADWSGAGLYLLLLVYIFTYNLLRLNLQRLLPRRR